MEIDDAIVLLFGVEICCIHPSIKEKEGGKERSHQLPVQYSEPNRMKSPSNHPDLDASQSSLFLFRLISSLCRRRCCEKGDGWALEVSKRNENEGEDETGGAGGGRR